MILRGMALLVISKLPCRICFDTAENTIPLSWTENGKTLAEMLYICVKLEFHESDGLPFQCCVVCRDDLIVAYKLLIRCKLSDSKFRLQLAENSICSPANADIPKTQLEPSIDFGHADSFKKESDKSSADEECQEADDGNDNFVTLNANESNHEAVDDQLNNDTKKDIKDKCPIISDVKNEVSKNKRRKYVQRKIAKTPLIPKRCCKCKTRFGSLEDAEQHTKFHMRSKEINLQKIAARPYECNACFKRYTKKRALQLHQQEMYADKPFECDECKQDFESKDQFSAHKEYHSREAKERKRQLPKCCACYEQFDSEASLQTHCREVHLPESQTIDAVNGNDFACSVCFRRYKSRRSLLNHKLKPYRVKQYQCSQCGRIFRDKCALSDHERCHQGERPFVCPVCSKTFAIKDSFRKHVKSHDIEDDHFKCETCGKGFKTKGNLKDHYITHASDYRPIGCSLCSATFARKSCLKSHMRMHTGEKPFKCHLCEASYAFSSDLKRHIMAHTGVKPYICNVCGRGYPRQDYLRKHLVSHNTSSVVS